MLKIFYNISTHLLEKVDVENKISYDWDSGVPHVADFPSLVAVNSPIKQDRKRDVVYKTRWEIILSVFIILLFVTVWNIDIDDRSVDSSDIKRIQTIITNFDTANKNSFGDWRTCEIIMECLGKSDDEIHNIVESNYLQIKK